MLAFACSNLAPTLRAGSISTHFASSLDGLSDVVLQANASQSPESRTIQVHNNVMRGERRSACIHCQPSGSKKFQFCVRDHQCER